MEERSLRVLEYDKIIQMLKEQCASSLGKEMALALLPGSDRSQILQALEDTTEAQGVVLYKGSPPFSQFTDIIPFLRRVDIGGFLDGGQLLRCADSMYSARRVRSFLKGMENAPRLSSLATDLAVLTEIEEQIRRCILSEEEVSDHASPDLKRIRRSMQQTKEQVRAKLSSIVTSSTYAKYLQDTVITMREDRFVVPVKVENKQHIPGIVHDSSASGATLFVEPVAVVELNNKLRSLRAEEKQEIERILAELSAEVAAFSEELEQNQIILQRLDFIFAKGKLSLHMKAIAPELSDEMVLNLKQARHPLIDPAVVVASDILVGGEYDTLVITGPNTGGKTVTLKTVGLLTLMMQSGLHIPCDYGSRMCVFGDVFSDIGDEQSIEQSLSTFSGHMSHIVSILSEQKDGCLILLDELGSGTDPVEGAALAVSILEHIRKKRCLTIATTHYSELKQYALTQEGVENGSVEFDVSTLSPTYRLIIGVPGKSNAFEISRKLGLADEIIDAARSMMQTETLEMEEILQELELEKKKVEWERVESKRLYEEARLEKEALDEKLDRLEKQKEKMLRNAKHEASKIARSAKEESERIIKELQAMREYADSKGWNKKLEDLRREMRGEVRKRDSQTQERLMERVRKKQEPMELGDEVYAPSLNQEGEILEIDRNKRTALVLFGSMRMNVPLNTLEKRKMKKQTFVNKISHGSGGGKSSVKDEIDLRGMDLETALDETHQYVDQAYLSGLPSVTVIHGIGTNVLRNGVQGLLKTIPYIERYRPGAYGEGGKGVTIVEFKKS